MQNLVNRYHNYTQSIQILKYDLEKMDVRSTLKYFTHVYIWPSHTGKSDVVHTGNSNLVHTGKSDLEHTHRQVWPFTPTGKPDFSHTGKPDLVHTGKSDLSHTQVSLTFHPQASLTSHTQGIYLTDLGQGAGVVELPLVLGQEHCLRVHCWWITHSSQRYIELFGITLPLNVYLQIHKQYRYEATRYGKPSHYPTSAICNNYLKLLIIINQDIFN